MRNYLITVTSLNHNNVRLAAAAPENGLQIVATPNLALSEIFILYKGRLKFHLGAIEDTRSLKLHFSNPMDMPEAS